MRQVATKLHGSFTVAKPDSSVEPMNSRGRLQLPGVSVNFIPQTREIVQRGLGHHGEESRVFRQDVLFQIVQRVDALTAFLSSEDGKNLLAGYKRAVNILVAEEKKDGTIYSGTLALGSLKGAEEAALARAVEVAHAGAAQKTTSGNYAGAMTSLASLRAPVDKFFEAVLVNDPDPTLRANRLNLLARLRDTMHLVADFSRIAG